MEKHTKILIGSALFFGAVMIINSRRKSLIQPKTLIFIGGLDNKTGYKNLQEQEELVRKGLKSYYQIFSHRYNDLQGALASVKKYPKSKIILFSAAGSFSKDIAQTLKDNGGNLSDMYIVEPYYSSGSSGINSANSVRSAVSIGVPAKNVYTGTYMSAGLGIVQGASKTPTCAPTHWCALTKIAEML